MSRPQKILLIQNNLFFSSRIENSVRALGYEIETLSNPQAARNPSEATLVIINLAARALDPLSRIQKLKEGGAIIVGYAGHKEALLLESARKAGCDFVVSNAMIHQDLPSILQKAEDLLHSRPQS